MKEGSDLHHGEEDFCVPRQPWVRLDVNKAVVGGGKRVCGEWVGGRWRLVGG